MKIGPVVVHVSRPRRHLDRADAAHVDRAVLACLEYYAATHRGPRRLEDVAAYAKEWLVENERQRIACGETAVAAIAGRWDLALLVGSSLQRLKRAGRVELVRGAGGGWRLA